MRSPWCYLDLSHKASPGPWVAVYPTVQIWKSMVQYLRSNPCIVSLVVGSGTSNLLYRVSFLSFSFSEISSQYFLVPGVPFFSRKLVLDLFSFASCFLHLHVHLGPCSRKTERRGESHRVSSHLLKTTAPLLREIGSLNMLVSYGSLLSLWLLLLWSKDSSQGAKKWRKEQKREDFSLFNLSIRHPVPTPHIVIENFSWSSVSTMPAPEFGAVLSLGEGILQGRNWWAYCQFSGTSPTCPLPFTFLK